MVNFQKINFLRFLITNSVTTGARELNGTSVISLATNNSRDLDEVSTGLARMEISGIFIPCARMVFRVRSLFKCQGGGGGGQLKGKWRGHMLLCRVVSLKFDFQEGVIFLKFIASRLCFVCFFSSWMLHFSNYVMLIAWFERLYVDITHDL